MKFGKFYFLLSAVLFANGGIAQDIVSLPKKCVKQDKITLSGFSSGGTMAQQVYFSYSSIISGIAVFSHSYYRCGPPVGDAVLWDDACTKLGGPTYDVNLALLDIQNYTRKGLIDVPTNMANKPLYVFAGTSNYLFTTDMSLAIVNVFEPFINNMDMIETHVENANLIFPSNRTGLPRCWELSPSGVSSCGYYGALRGLQFLLGQDVIVPPGDVILQPLLEFDQTEFFFGVEDSDQILMDTTGFLYIPTGCIDDTRQCLLHIFFHGCNFARQFVGTDQIVQSGYLEVAEQNNIIIAFPQTINSTGNVWGCWDGFGLTGPLFATQRGAQVTVVKNMLDRLMGLECEEPITEEPATEEPYQEENYYSEANPGGIDEEDTYNKEAPKATPGQGCTSTRVSKFTFLETCT